MVPSVHWRRQREGQRWSSNLSVCRVESSSGAWGLKVIGNLGMWWWVSFPLCSLHFWWTRPMYFLRFIFMGFSHLLSFLPWEFHPLANNLANLGCWHQVYTLSGLASSHDPLLRVSWKPSCETLPVTHIERIWTTPLVLIFLFHIAFRNMIVSGSQAKK